ncbi:nuclear transport factor 2 family protein [Endozoicomonas lisbonensis]|uniref:nuclear transport factor 2 family protein n=1 Tax=Endozoicomonas lisbonensis TaxID=3120522 RepID=UPI0033983BA7
MQWLNRILDSWCFYTYLSALNNGDLNQVLSLFTEDAVVVSPLYGEILAKDFYKELFSDTEQSETTLLTVFDSSKNDDSIALHFRYRWTLQSKEIVEFECVDVFNLTEDKTLFTRLTIIYDTYPVRKKHSESQRVLCQIT